MDWSPDDGADFVMNDWLPHFSQFDEWDYAQYAAFQSNHLKKTDATTKCDSSSGSSSEVDCGGDNNDDSNKGGKKTGASKDSAKASFKPAAWFSFEDDWDEMDVQLDGLGSGQIVLVKFLRPRGASSERLGIVGVKFYGYKRTPPCLGVLSIENAVPIAKYDRRTTTTGIVADDDDVVSGDAVFMRVLGFLIDVSEDQMAMFHR